MSALLRGRCLGHRYGTFTALQGVDVEIRAGEVLAIVGENGAGKSTLLKLLAGLNRPTSGTLAMPRPDGQWHEVRLRSARHALQSGIALVHQEVCLAEDLHVAGALLLGCEPRRWGLLDRDRGDALAKEWLARVGLDVHPSVHCGSLPIAQRQQVEIAKALGADARILILDEPSSCLSAHESARLLGIVRQLRDAGVAIILVSHHLDEVLRVADRAIVLRDGRLVGELAGEAWTRAQLERLMVGREIEARRRTAPSSGIERVVLDVRDLRPSGFRHSRAAQTPITLRVGEGEIVGLAGLVGAGRTEALEAIAGLCPSQGRVLLDGGELHGDFRERSRRCVAFVPEDRARHGVCASLAAAANVSLHCLPMVAHHGLVDGAGEHEAVLAASAKAKLPEAMLGRTAGTLSGGNQQKAVVARWLAAKPRLWLLDEPTRGVDVASRAQIHEAIRAAAEGGTAVLFASSDMEELLLLADRVLVMHEGCVAAELRGEAMTEAAIIRLATGGDVDGCGAAA